MATASASSPKVNMVSLGHPKYLVASKLILTRLRAESDALSPDNAGANVEAVD